LLILASEILYGLVEEIHPGFTKYGVMSTIPISSALQICINIDGL